jgi:hypothetical protein
MQVICNKCGLVDNYRTELKNGQKVAHCNGCNSFIKNIPYQPAKFYFGKYKDTLISDCNDLQYCEWFLGNTNPKANIKLAVINKIIDLKNKS